MTQLLVPAQSFEIKQLLWDLATNDASESEFYRHVQRMSYSIIMTATYGRRVERWENEDAQRALESSKVLGKISKPGVFLEDEIPALALLPTWLQPSQKLALQYAKPVNGAKLRLWDILKRQMSQGAAPACFAHDLMLSDYQGRGLADNDAAWIAGGLSLIL